MKIATIDIETTTTLDTIWCCGIHYHDGGSIIVTTPEAFTAAMEGVGTVVTYNGISFDIPLLQALWGISFDGIGIIDAMVMSRLYNPSLEGGHSLRAWGDRLNWPKGDFTDYDGGYCEEMALYCQRDVELTTKVYYEVKKLLEEDGFSQDSVDLEHAVTTELALQERNGFKLDLAHANQLYSTLTHRMRQIEDELQAKFPPIVTERWSEKTGKQLKDSVEVFNVGSRQQIVKRLSGAGVRFTEKTEAGQYKVDETVLGAIDHPDAQLVAEYLIVQKRASQVSSWLEAVGEDGRVHGRVISSGAATGRMTHIAPNMAQIPSVRKVYDGMSHIDRVKAEYGAACRACWTVEEGNKLVGVDASGLELRMLAHYMKDSDYVSTILDGDIHSENQKAAGLDTRDQAKTFIYAFLYGAGDAKIGSIAGKGATHGKKLKRDFLNNVPSLKALKDLVENIADKSGYLPSLDGRRIRIRKAYSALNFLLQGGGAVLMKKALLIGVKTLRSNDIPFKIVANVHDEVQVETPQHFAKAVGIHFRNAIRAAGEELGLRCPMDGEYKIGDNWSETH
jgi:DNA polymerase I-like protein with 3'-5' exonuclease and polymerase domains